MINNKLSKISLKSKEISENLVKKENIRSKIMSDKTNKNGSFTLFDSGWISTTTTSPNWSGLANINKNQFVPLMIDQEFNIYIDLPDKYIPYIRAVKLIEQPENTEIAPFCERNLHQYINKMRLTSDDGVIYDGSYDNDSFEYGQLILSHQASGFDEEYLSVGFGGNANAGGEVNGGKLVYGNLTNVAVTTYGTRYNDGHTVPKYETTFVDANIGHVRVWNDISDEFDYFKTSINSIEYDEETSVATSINITGRSVYIDYELQWSDVYDDYIYVQKDPIIGIDTIDVDLTGSTYIKLTFGQYTYYEYYNNKWNNKGTAYYTHPTKDIDNSDYQLTLKITSQPTSKFAFYDKDQMAPLDIWPTGLSSPEWARNNIYYETYLLSIINFEVQPVDSIFYTHAYDDVYETSSESVPFTYDKINPVDENISHYNIKTSITGVLKKPAEVLSTNNRTSKTYNLVNYAVESTVVPLNSYNADETPVNVRLKLIMDNPHFFQEVRKYEK